MTPHIEQAWCPECREWTVLDAGIPCAWCGTTLVHKRGGFKRPDIVGRINERMARAIHEKYLADEISARTLGKKLWRTLGYRSAETCERAIGAAFRRYDLPRRERIEATVLASTRNGLSPRDAKERRRRRIEAGLTIKATERRPLCAGVRTSYPRKGEPCQRPATTGSEFCVSHDPKRAEARRENLERMWIASGAKKAA